MLLSDSKKCLRKDIITAIVSLMKADSFEEVRSKRAKLKLLGLPSGEEIDVE